MGETFQGTGLFQKAPAVVQVMAAFVCKGQGVQDFLVVDEFICFRRCRIVRYGHFFLPFAPSEIEKGARPEKGRSSPVIRSCTALVLGSPCTQGADYGYCNV